VEVSTTAANIDIFVEGSDRRTIYGRWEGAESTPTAVRIVDVDRRKARVLSGGQNYQHQDFSG